MHTLMNTAEKRSTPSCSEMAHLSLQRLQDLEVLFTKHTVFPLHGDCVYVFPLGMEKKHQTGQVSQRRLGFGAG